MGPATMMAIASLGGKMIGGGGQFGSIAPPFQAGLSPGLLNPMSYEQPALFRDNGLPTSGLDLFNSLQQASPEPAPIATPTEIPLGGVNPVDDALKQSSLADIDNGIAENDPQNPFSQFFGNLDSNLQSPSKQLGLGLLGQLNPNLPYAGLLAMGLLGKNKIFGGQ